MQWSVCEILVPDRARERLREPELLVVSDLSFQIQEPQYLLNFLVVPDLENSGLGATFSKIRNTFLLYKVVWFQIFKT